MTLDELKLEADKLGVSYHPNIGKETLELKIKDFKAAAETKPIETVKATVVKSPKVEDDLRRKGSRLVRISSKDRSEANLESVYVSSMGRKAPATAYPVPLDKDVFLPEYIIDSLKETKISQPRNDPNTGKVSFNMVNKYVINYLD